MESEDLKWMEVLKMISRKKRKENIENRLRETKQYILIEGKMCFIAKDGGFIRLDTIGDDQNCIVIEYAENEKDARNNVFEDGDLLYMNELSEDEMVKEVIKQIEEV